MRLAGARHPPRRHLACRAGDEAALARAAALTGLPFARLAALPRPLRGRLADTTSLTRSILALKAALPGADVTELLGRAPGLLDPAAAAAAIAAVPAARRLLMGGCGGGGGQVDELDGGQNANVDAMIAAQPLLLTADLEEVADEIRR